MLACGTVIIPVAVKDFVRDGGGFTSVQLPAVGVMLVRAALCAAFGSGADIGAVVGKTTGNEDCT